MKYRRRPGVAEHELGAELLVLALDVAEHDAAVRFERIGPRRYDPEVAGVAAIDGAQDPRAGGDRVVVADAKAEEPLVETAIGVDLCDDFLSDVATLGEGERILEPRLLGVDLLRDVAAEDTGDRFRP